MKKAIARAACASSRTTMRKLYKPRQNLLLCATPTSAVEAVIKTRMPAAPNAKINLEPGMTWPQSSRTGLLQPVRTKRKNLHF